MNILAMVIESTFNSQRKYFHWHLKVLSFLMGVSCKKNGPHLEMRTIPYYII